MMKSTLMADIQLLILYCSLFVSLFFEVFLLITYLEVRGELQEEKDRLARGVSFFPTVSIVVPSYNEERTVAATVKSLLKLNYPKDKLSLVLVDDGSTDKTLKVLRQFKNHPQIRIIAKENGGKHTAVNLALKSIDTDLVGCLDADSFVNPDALEKIVMHFEDETVMAVTPSIKVHEPKNILQYIQKTEYSWSIFLRRMVSSLGALYVTPGPFSIFRVSVFKDLGDYRHAHMTEDMEMAMRMQKNGYKIVNAHSAHVYTVTPATLRTLVKQRARWTYGFINNGYDYREMFFNKKYGNIGLFILPIAMFSIFSALFMVSNVMYGWFNLAMNSLTRYQAVGFSWKLSAPSFDWYFINTGVLPMIVITTLSLMVLILLLALKLAEGSAKIHRGVFYYLFLYTFMVPLWLLRALFDTAFKRKVSWR
jgi:cellulose synthase/poly-beta-1,6-N-acetylglucosamine synthase-like glycosyltransferase